MVNVCIPLKISFTPTFTVMVKLVELTDDVVEKVNIAPLFTEVGVMKAALDDETVKSEATPVVAPLRPDTEILQMIAFPARCGFPDTQASAEAVVGVPYTAIDC